MPTPRPTTPTAKPTFEMLASDLEDLMSSLASAVQSLPVQNFLALEAFESDMKPVTAPATMPTAPTPKPTYASDELPPFESDTGALGAWAGTEDAAGAGLAMGAV